MTRSNQKALFLRLLFCIFCVGLTLYLSINKQNELTELRLQIPQLSKEVKAIQEENIRLQYEVDRFESPIHLMELARKPEFSHLKHPFLKDIIIIQELTSIPPTD
jgi:cell division protein FtsB